MHYRNILLFPVIFLLYLGTLNAQDKSGNVWCFGYHNEVNFNSGAAVTGPCVLDAMTGSGSIADPVTGILQFYTDGITVWDNSNTKMPGNTTPLDTFSGGTSTPLIVPMPGSGTKYYIFTPGFRFSYTIIDMTLRSGLGDVSQQPQVLLADTTTLITGTFIQGSNGVWVLIHLLLPNVFYAYPVTSAGIGSPVISYQGDINNSPINMKMSPDGTMIGAVYQKTSTASARTTVFGFNNSTGSVYAPFFIDSTYSRPAVNGDPSGISFSPHSRLLYISISDDSLVFQYNLMAPGAGAILASRQTLIASMNGGTGASPIDLQLAYDKKIYVDIFDSQHMDVINYPDIIGPGCNYVKNGFGLGNDCLNGLPIFIDHVFAADSILPLQEYMASTTTCMGSCAAMAAIIPYEGYPPYSYLWQPGGYTTDTIRNLCAGTYYVTITDSTRNTLNDSVQITALSVPQVTITGDSFICTGRGGTIFANAPGAISFVWDSGQTSRAFPWHSVDSAGIYSVTVAGYNGCTAVASKKVSAKRPPLVTPYVNRDTFEALTTDSVHYQWIYEFNDTLVNATNKCDSTMPGLYEVIVQDTNGCSTVLFFGTLLGVINLQNDVVQLYPNPSVSSEWQLSVSDDLVGAQYEIFDDNGKHVYKSEIQQAHSTFDIDLARGIYFLHIHSARAVIIRKLIRL